MILHRRQRAPGRRDVEGDFRGMHFEREVDVFFFKHVKDRQPAFGEVGETFVQKFLTRRRKRVKRMPDAGAGEAVHDGGALRTATILFCGCRVKKFSRGAGGGFHFFGGALADAFGLAVAPDIGGQNGPVPFVNQIAHGLADEVTGNGKTFHPVLG